MCLKSQKFQLFNNFNYHCCKYKTLNFIKNSITLPKLSIPLEKVYSLFIDKNLRIWIKYQNRVSVFNSSGEFIQDFPEINNQDIFWRGRFPIKEDVLGKIWIHLGFGFFYNSLKFGVLRWLEINS